MAGGAAVLGGDERRSATSASPSRCAPTCPATENMPGGRAIKPGDVVRAYNGTTIEVLNTDAEGRLVLADALAYAAAAKPDVLIDLATLTAAVRTALGNRYAAIMGTDAALVQALIDAGRECGENLWELPLVAEYRARHRQHRRRHQEHRRRQRRHDHRRAVPARVRRQRAVGAHRLLQHRHDRQTVRRATRAAPPASACARCCGICAACNSEARPRIRAYRTRAAW